MPLGKLDKVLRPFAIQGTKRLNASFAASGESFLLDEGQDQTGQLSSGDWKVMGVEPQELVGIEISGKSELFRFFPSKKINEFLHGEQFDHRATSRGGRGS